MTDLVFSLLPWAFVLSAGALYSWRVTRRGRAVSARADQHGGSVLMSKHLVELSQWTFAPWARILAKLGATPDGVTWFSLIPGIGAGLAVAWGWFGLAAFLGTVSAFCDTLDGILARHIGVGSEAGETLDAVADRYTEGAFLGGLIVYYHPSLVMTSLCVLALFGAFMVSYSTAKAEAQGVTPPRGSMRRGERALYMLAGASFVPGFRMLAPPDWPPYLQEAPMVLAVSLIAVVANVSSVRRIAKIRAALRVGSRGAAVETRATV
jgi:CDP-diacylglycerol--glycerol-3-phosphate 3-phosphatidyltransferase